MTGRFVDHELRVRRNRRKKLIALKEKLANAKTVEERERLIEKIRRRTIYLHDVPGLKK